MYSAERFVLHLQQLRRKIPSQKQPRHRGRGRAHGILSSRLLIYCPVLTMPIPIIATEFQSVPPVHMPRSVKPRSAIPYGAATYVSKTFSQNIKSIVRQRDHHKNKTIFKLLVNKMPVRRIIEVAGIDPNTFYHRLDFLRHQCQAFAAHRERALANLAIRRLYLGVDRQDYLVHWLVRKTSVTSNYPLLLQWTITITHCFGVHLNFDPKLNSHSRPSRSREERRSQIALSASSICPPVAQCRPQQSQCKVHSHGATHARSTRSDR